VIEMWATKGKPHSAAHAAPAGDGKPTH